MDLFFSLMGADGFGFLRDMLDDEAPGALIRPTGATEPTAPLGARPLALGVLAMAGQGRASRVVAHATPDKSADALMRLMFARATLEDSFCHAMLAHRHDAILCPALPIAAPPHGSVKPHGRFLGLGPARQNALGWPAAWRRSRGCGRANTTPRR